MSQIKKFFGLGNEKPRAAAAADAIIKAMPDALIVLDLNGAIVNVNPAMTKMFGYTPEERIGKSFDGLTDIIKPEDVERFMKLFGELIETGHVEPVEIVLGTKDGREVPVSVTYSLIKDAEGNPKNVVAVLRDITELKRLQEKERQSAVTAAVAEKERRASAEKMAEKLKEEIKEKTKKIREVERLRERFMADASHELRTPLAVLQTNLDLLSQLPEAKSSPFSKNVEDLIESSKNRAKHLTAIIEELSFLSKGKRPEELREIIKLETISEETIEELQSLADTKNINCQVKILDRDLEVMGDETMLRKVTSNLVSNAIKYGRERGKIKVTLRKEAGEAELEVSDNGTGISRKDLSHIFERFYRVRKGGRSKEKKRGVGLGLAICKWIVELHGGRIEAETKYGKGSKFKVFLPLKGTWESRMGLWDYKIRRMSPKR